MRKSLLETAVLLQTGEFQSDYLIRSASKAIQNLQSLNLYLEFDESTALEEAQKISKDQPRSSLVSGTLISVKDNFFVKKTRTSAASKALENLIAPYDATVVKSLRDKSAIIFGKTNMDEFGMGSSTSNSAFGPTQNPWNHLSSSSVSPEDILSPGGSSGGSAGAVASYLCHGAIGSDTGGSVRQPASFCGIVGFKPTYGSLSRHGLISYASSFDTPGILTRSVMDSALLFDAMYRGKDLNDPTSVDLYPSHIFSPSSSASASSLLAPGAPLSCLHTNPSKLSSQSSSLDLLQSLASSQSQPSSTSLLGVVIGVPVEYSLAELDPQVRSLWEDTLRMLQDAGATVRTISLPSLRMALPTYYLLACAEASSNLSRYDGLRYGYRSSLSPLHRSSESSESPENIADELHREMSQSRGEGFGPQVLRRILAGTFVLSESAYHDYFSKAVQARQLIVSELQSCLSSASEEGRVDCIVGPTSPILPFTRKEEPHLDFASMLLNDFMTVAANLTGSPAINVPVGVATKTRAAGTVSGSSSGGSVGIPVPVGMQVMAGRGREDLIFRTALAIEQRAAFQLQTV